MTRRYVSGVVPALFLLLLIAGCGGSATSRSAAPPHGGSLVDLPEGRGYVEILKQTAPGKAGRSSIVVYFLDPDKNAMTPVPSAVTFKGQVTGNKPIAFKPIEGAGATKAGGLASEPIADRGEIEGDLTATTGSGPVTVPIMIR